MYVKKKKSAAKAALRQALKDMLESGVNPKYLLMEISK